MNVTITGKDLTIAEVVAVARDFAEVELSKSKDVIRAIEDSAAFVDDAIKNQKLTQIFSQKFQELKTNAKITIF